MHRILGNLYLSNLPNYLHFKTSLKKKLRLRKEINKGCAIKYILLKGWFIVLFGELSVYKISLSTSV
jgi:hypothetical protein